MNPYRMEVYLFANPLALFLIDPPFYFLIDHFYQPIGLERKFLIVPHQHEGHSPVTVQVF